MNAETQENQQDNAVVTITLPDGATQSCVAGTTPLDVAKGISQGLAKKVVAAELDGAVYDIDWPIEQSCTMKLIKRDDDDALPLIRHDCAHVMAEAVQTLFPGTQVTIGPVIENGFYYDFAREDGFSSDDLQAIEAKMAEIVERDAPFTREVWDRAEAIEYFRDIGEDYKAEIIQDLPENEPVRIYRQGEWLDLCRGPHMPGTAHVGTAFKLTKLAGAYWRGDSSRAMLTRIYGTAWRTKDELDAYLKQLEEAEARDHRKLGREMDLFHFQPEAQGSAFWHPRGFRIWRELESYIRRRLDDAGYNEIKTPQLIDNALWQKSGHWGKFRENMFVVPDEVPSTDNDDNVLSGEGRLMALKPMNCPAHVQIFKQGITSYRDLPIRMAEFGCCHRNEAHGALHGLMRVRQMTQDDAHIFCRTDQIKSEVGAFVELCQSVYSDFGFDNVSVKLATRPDNRAGSDEVWDHAEQAMARALQDLNIDYETLPGEGAFYGPKYEFHLKDAIGRSWQMGTCQLDFVMPERLEAEYVGADGDKHTAVMIHRAIFGTLERFIGMLIESSAGKLPLWLAPVQCVVATITDAAADYAEQVHSELKQAGLRSECDTRNEKINYKIREHSNMKTPVIFVVGEREAAENTVAIRRLGSQAQEVNDRAGAISDLAKACQPPY